MFASNAAPFRYVVPWKNGQCVVQVGDVQYRLRHLRVVDDKLWFRAYTITDGKAVALENDIMSVIRTLAARS